MKKWDGDFLQWVSTQNIGDNKKQYSGSDVL
jgi:hypothetical protein